MRILLLAHSFNSLTQRVFIELRQKGHDVAVEFDINDAVTVEAVELAQPDLIVAPFLKRAIPEAVWRNHVCLVVHPGPEGDAGPSALDWAVLNGETEWGVTVLQADAEFDGGPVWAAERFALRPGATKASLYRNEVMDAAVRCVLKAVDAYPNRPKRPQAERVWRPLMKQVDRAIDWAADDTATVLRKIRSADGMPGLLDQIGGEAVYLFDAQAADLTGEPGALIARAGTKIARATRDGAVWIGHLRRKDGDHPLKLPATHVVDASVLPEVPGPAEVWYEEKNGIGYLHFPFYNGAMSAEQCLALRDAFVAATEAGPNVLVLLGGPDYWSNGIHLNVIENAASPAEESWRTINAMDYLCQAIIEATGHIVIAAMRGNAGAGGVFLALAADHVLARDGIVLNPHYKGMGNLYGSEYWTYLLPRRCGPEQAKAVTEARLPIGVKEARKLGLIDDHFGGNFLAGVEAFAESLNEDPGLTAILAAKKALRDQDEAAKPLAAYRAEELERMKLNFFGFDPSYHVARYHFVHKLPKSRTPLYLARHRRKPHPAG